jgi:hypothetical protein
MFPPLNIPPLYEKVCIYTPYLRAISRFLFVAIRKVDPGRKQHIKQNIMKKDNALLFLFTITYSYEIFINIRQNLLLKL